MSTRSRFVICVGSLAAAGFIRCTRSSEHAEGCWSAARAPSLSFLFATPHSADWTTYHADNNHSGNDATAPPIAGSGIAWTSTNLAGDVTAEPLCYNGVVYIATMQDYLYALNPANGAILWADHLDNAYDTSTPLPCGNDFSFIGIMGTPVIDAATGTLYAVDMISDGTYHLWAINLSTHGLVYAPVVITDNVLFDPAIHNQRGALTLYNGQLFIPFGGRDGDCGNYHGWVFRINAADGGGLISYPTAALGAGIWGRSGGIVVNGDYTVATGNAVGSDQCSSTFDVTVTNKGNATWPHTGYTEVDLDLHFTTATGGSGQQSNWLSSLAFSLPADVAPGTSATLSLTLTAPSVTTTTSMFLEAEMIKEHQFWFSSVNSVAVSVAAANWSVIYNISSAPSTWAAGQSKTFNVTLTNNGNVSWLSTGYTEVDLDLHFTTVTGGSAALEAQMIKEHRFWFPWVASIPVTVG